MIRYLKHFSIGAIALAVLSGCGSDPGTSKALKSDATDLRKERKALSDQEKVQVNAKSASNYASHSGTDPLAKKSQPSGLNGTTSTPSTDAYYNKSKGVETKQVVTMGALALLVQGVMGGNFKGIFNSGKDANSSGAVAASNSNGSGGSSGIGATSLLGGNSFFGGANSSARTAGASNAVASNAIASNAMTNVVAGNAIFATAVAGKAIVAPAAGPVIAANALDPIKPEKVEQQMKAASTAPASAPAADAKSVAGQSLVLDPRRSSGSETTTQVTQQAGSSGPGPDQKKDPANCQPDAMEVQLEKGLTKIIEMAAAKVKVEGSK